LLKIGISEQIIEDAKQMAIDFAKNVS